MSKENKTIENNSHAPLSGVSQRLDHIKEGDYIAFPFTYNGSEPDEIIVDNITSVYPDRFLVHFLYGHHSLSEFVAKEDVIAIGNHEAKGKIKGWGGSYEILKPEHPLLRDGD